MNNLASNPNLDEGFYEFKIGFLHFLVVFIVQIILFIFGAAIRGQDLRAHGKIDEDFQLSLNSYNRNAFHSSGFCAVISGLLLELKLFNSREYD